MRAHRDSLDEHGGIDGVRDEGAIESALAAAQNTWLYRNSDVFEIAATYAYHLAESQAFLDGNKRTAIASALIFSPASTPGSTRFFSSSLPAAAIGGEPI